MRQPSIVENNELLNAPDYESQYRETERKLQTERPDLWAYVLQMRGRRLSAHFKGLIQ